MLFKLNVKQLESSFFIIGGDINPDEVSEVATYKNSKGVIVVIIGTLNDPLWVPSTGAVFKLLK